MNKKMNLIFKVINYLIIRINRPAMERKLSGLQEYHFGTRKADYSKIKADLLNDILEYSQNKCPYYKELYKSIGIKTPNIHNLDKIPFLDKQMIRSNYMKLQSVDIEKVTNYIMKSGGTTGTPLTFPVSSHYEYGHHKFAFELFGYVNGDNIVRFDGTEVGEANTKLNIYWKTMSRNNLPYGKISFSSLYLNNNTAKFYFAHLNKLKPAFIRGYPSSINFLAIYMMDNNLKFDFELKAVFLTAESIFTNHIKNIIKAFSTSVSLEYGHSEVSIFAYTIDDNYEYYCSPFYGYTEVLDMAGNHVNEGELGEVVVTGFYNRSMPFIRYKTGDMAVYNGERDGLTCLSKIEGRTQDYLLNKQGEKIFVVGAISSTNNTFIQHIKKWQIIQNEPGVVSVKIIKSDQFSIKDELDIVAFFTEDRKIVPLISYVNEIQTTSRGKNKLVVQNITI